MTLTLAVTGSTGFVGGHVIDRALAAGHVVRALTRRPQPARDGVTWITGTLDNVGALAEGTDAVVHVAGVVNAPTRDGFAVGNIAGTQAMLSAARRAGVTRFVHVSSLAAREPGLSNYGWSKHGAEQAAEASGLAWTIVRPPAVYGPGDHELLDMFRMARLGLAFLPPPGMMSAIHVEDLAALLVTLAERGDPGTLFEPDDGTAISHVHFGEAIGKALGRRVMALPLPRPLLSLAARIDGRVRGARAKLTPDRVAYMCHPDWTATPDLRPPSDLWRPQITLDAGLAATAAWYRAHRLL